MSLSTATRPRPTGGIPYAESQPARAARRAAPTGCQSSAGSSTMARVTVASTLCRWATPSTRHERFTTTLKFFRGAEQPVHTFISEPFAGDQHLSLRERRPAGGAGRSAASRVWSRSPRAVWTTRPSHFPWVDSWLEFSADDGSLSGSVPGFVFKGGTTKRVMSGKWQHWPGVAANADVRHVGAAAQLPSAADGGSLRPVRALGPHAEFGDAEHRRAHAAHVRSRSKSLPGARELLSARGWLRLAAHLVGVQAARASC